MVGDETGGGEVQIIQTCIKRILWKGGERNLKNNLDKILKEYDGWKYVNNYENAGYYSLISGRNLFLLWKDEVITVCCVSIWQNEW